MFMFSTLRACFCLYSTLELEIHNLIFPTKNNFAKKWFYYTALPQYVAKSVAENIYLQ